MRFPPAILFALVVAAFAPPSLHADVTLQIEAGSGRMTLRADPLDQPITKPAELLIEASSDLRIWTPHYRKILPPDSAAGVGLEIPELRDKQFFRLRSNFDVNLVREDGAEILGFGDRFALTLAQSGQISPAEFARLFPDRSDYLPALSWDPTTAQFFAEFQAELPVGTPQPWRVKPVNFKLNETELAIFKKNGFVATTRIAQTNFCDLYYDVFVRDLPVFVTTDSLLHAWFRSYETILIQLEELYLFPTLSNVLDSAAAQVSQLQAELGSGPLAQSVRDVDYFLTVARSLAAGVTVPSALGQDQLVQDTLSRIEGGNFAMHFGIFERPYPSPFDFSQFKVRGHYDGSPLLRRYFQSMMWCGRLDFRVAGNSSLSSARELGTALVLTETVKRSGQIEAWQKIDSLIQLFIGAKDSMDLRQMEQILHLAQIDSLDAIKSVTDLDRIKSAIENGQFGIQEIMGEGFEAPFGPTQLWLPRSFTLLGQRFTMDGWGMGKVVFDRVLWSENGSTTKVIRRRASALDIAFSVLNNNLVTPEILARIENPSGLKFRDGLPYQHNLAAVRAVIDAQQESYWSSTIYNQWLATLRTLSDPTTDSRYPEAMRTRAWALRRLNSQLGSWTQLRHASILYAKPTYIPFYLCSYPAGFVEPMPQFWTALQKLVDTAHDAIATLPMQGQATWHARQGFTNTTTMDLGLVKSNQLQFLSRFRTNVATLRALSEKELAQQPFSTEEETFLLDLVEVHKDYEGVKTYSGWYPRLYYGGNEGFDALTQQARRQNGQWISDHDASKSAALVADVLTATPDGVVGDPGAVLHQGIGNIHFMLVAVDNGPDKMVYGGPIYGHYEFSTVGVERLNDTEWEAKVLDKTQPASPDWTSDWLVP